MGVVMKLVWMPKTLDNDLKIVKYGIKYICEFCISTYNSWY